MSAAAGRSADIPAATFGPTPFPVKLVSGAVGGVVGTGVIFPLDLAKTRLQNQTVTSTIQFRGIFHCLTASFAEGGLSGLYRGLLPNLVGVMPEKALKLACNAQFREMLADGDGSVSVIGEVAAGALTGFVQCSITTPMEIVKIRAQMAPSATSTVQVIRDLGLGQLYKGNAATLLRDVPFSILFFTLNCKLKEAFAADRDQPLPSSTAIAIGTFSGIIGAVAVTPSDVIKTRLQSKSSGGAQYTNVPDTFRTVLRQEGVAGFFKGASARAMVVGPLFGIATLSYDVFERFYHKYIA